MSFRASQFLITNEDGNYLCPACGLPGYFDGRQFQDDIGGVIGTGICPCCLYEPGFDDDPRASADARETIIESILFYRARWIDTGMPWYSDIVPAPAHWSATSQLEQLFVLAPFLADTPE
jgi:hypothetical protein